jgi:hypothetical protein
MPIAINCHKRILSKPKFRRDSRLMGRQQDEDKQGILEMLNLED